MAWRMPTESAPHERTWMAFPREGPTLGATAAERDECYHAWTAVAHAINQFEHVSMVVDPTETQRAERMLGSSAELVEAPLDEFWMRDIGPSFVVDKDRPGVLGAVDWTFNGWGDHAWAQWAHSAQIARVIAAHIGAELVSSMLVNEGGGFHVDGEGTVLLTDTVQLDPRRNPYADRARVEAEMARTVGAVKAIWLPRGLSRDYGEFGTSGHVDIVATFAGEGRVLLHEQRDAGHPDYGLTKELTDLLNDEFDAAGRRLEVLRLPAPATLRDDDGFVDWSYVNFLLVNGGIIACGFGENRADATARSVLEEAFPGRKAVTVDARPIFARGGGIHCITQQQPALVRT